MKKLYCKLKLKYRWWYKILNLPVKYLLKLMFRIKLIKIEQAIEIYASFIISSTRIEVKI